MITSEKLQEIIRYEFDKDKFFKKNKYILYISWILSIYLFSRVIYYTYCLLFDGLGAMLSEIIIFFVGCVGFVLVFTLLLPYLFIYYAKKAKYKTSFIEIKENICKYNKVESPHILKGAKRRVYYINKVSKVDSNSKRVYIYGEIHVKQYTEGLNNMEHYNTINKLKIPNYYKNIEEVSAFISSKIVKS